MIENLINIPARTTETNASGIIKVDSGEKFREEKESLFRQLFERVQDSDKKDDLDKKDSFHEDEFLKKGVQSAEKISVEIETDERNSERALNNSTSSISERTNRNEAETNTLENSSEPSEIKGLFSSGKEVVIDQAESENSGKKEEVGVLTRQETQNNKNENRSPARAVSENSVQQINRTGTVSAESVKNYASSNLHAEPIANENSGKKEEVGVLTRQETQNNKNENRSPARAVSENSVQQSNRTGTVSAESVKNYASSNVAASRIVNPFIQDVDQQKTEQISKKQAISHLSVLPKDEPGLGVQNAKNIQSDLNNISALGQAAKTPFEVTDISGNNNEARNDSTLPDDGKDIRIDTSGSDAGNQNRGMIMGQSTGSVLPPGIQEHTQVAAEFVRKAQAYIAENGEVNERNEDSESTAIRDDLLSGGVNKPEVFSIFSGIKKDVNPKNKEQDARPRLDVDEIVMRADTSERPLTEDLENRQFSSDGQHSVKWDRAAGMSRSLEKIDDSFTLKNFVPENISIKDVEYADQKNSNITHLASVTISNISVKRNVLPGLTQVVLSSAMGKTSSESWNKHSFVLEDGSKIQLAARKLDGVIHLKIGSTSPELNRLLQQHQHDILEHLKKESKLEVDLQFDNPKEESGFEFFEGRKRASKSATMENKNSIKPSTAGPREYAAGRSIRTFGYNNMEWTA